jgi:pyruvate/2-oxoglutarate dehydrogenase complex dihydrolipoamide acyltransferase (E2) component
MREPVVMPGLAEMEAGTVVEWRKRSGDWVEAGESIAYVDTDKVTVEVNAPASGYLQILAEEESEVAVGQPIAEILDRAEQSTKTEVGE